MYLTDRERFEVGAVQRGEYRLVLSSKRKRKLQRRGERIWWSRYFHGWVWDFEKIPF